MLYPWYLKIGTFFNGYVLLYTIKGHILWVKCIENPKILSSHEKVARCRLVHTRTILSIFVDFSMKKSFEFPISLRQLDLKHNFIARFARISLKSNRNSDDLRFRKYLQLRRIHESKSFFHQNVKMGLNSNSRILYP